MIRPKLTAVLLLAACACSATANNPQGVPAGTSSPGASEDAVVGGERATVTRIVDGDTIVVRRGQDEVKVRLIGVDTPETVDPRRPVGCYGKQASNFMKDLLTGKQVVLTYDVERLDRFGRTLAYVFLPDGTFVNLILVQRGYAQVLTIPPDVEHAKEFVAAQRAARSASLGLWDVQACPLTAR